MTRTRRFSQIVILLVAGAGFAACSSKSGSTDAGTDTRADAPVDKGADTTTTETAAADTTTADTTTTDGGTDSTTEAGGDARTEVGAEAGSDATTPASCLNGSTWTQTETSSNMCTCASSSWTFTANAGGWWDVAETGCAGATGTATFDGTNVVVTFLYSVGAGFYTFPLNACAGGAGTVRWTSGPCNGTSLPSTWTKKN